MKTVDTPTSTPSVVVIAGRSTEARLSALTVRPKMFFASDEIVSLETQQMEEASAVQAQSAHDERLRRLANPVTQTGQAKLFVLEPERLAVSDPDAHSALKALVTSQLKDSERTAVALLPPENGYSAAGQATADLIQNTVLPGNRYQTIDSVEDLESWVDNH